MMDLDSTTPHPIIWLDTTAAESAHASGSFMLACMPALNGSVTNVKQTGRIGGGVEVVGECMERCLKRCADVHAVVVKALVDAEEERRRRSKEVAV